MSGVGNSAVWSESGTLTLESGLLLVKKLDLLGFDGGAVNASRVVVKGGSLLIYTDSDNVPAIWAESTVLEGGSLHARCLRTEQVVAGSLTLAGGAARLEGHSPNSSGAGRDTFNASAADASGSGFLEGTTPTERVMLTNQPVTFCGKTVVMEVYNVNDNNYFKLRDVAALMNGSESSFSVSFDPDLRSVTACRGEAYTFVGGELLPGEDKSSTAVPSRWLLYVDGTFQPCAAVNVGSSNFFKLRDLADALGFHVDYDKEKRTVIIEP